MRGLLLLAMVSCGKDAESSRDTGFDQGIVFADVQPIFEARCSPCHYGSPTPSAGLRVDDPSTMVDVVHPATGLDLVRPGSTSDSYLWRKVTGSHLEVEGGTGNVMPPMGSLDGEELEVIRGWILGGAVGEGAGPVADTCADSAPDCEGNCQPGPATVTHVEWHNRLTESPPLQWDEVGQAQAYEVSVVAATDGEDVHCWTEVDDAFATLRSIWVLEAEKTYRARVRAVFADGTRSDATESGGWTVDIEPPEIPAELDDSRAPVDGLVYWDHPMTDLGAGFSHFELAVGTSPGADDAVEWSDVGSETAMTWASELSGLTGSSWYWLAVRAVDGAGNRSQPAVSTGFITCPESFSFVAADGALGTTPFCIATYEMRIAGIDDGNTAYDPSFVPESRPSGTPWASIEKGQSRVACDAMGFSYQLVTNSQWQAVARSIERTPANWSGGAVGVGQIPQGHSDEDPPNSLSAEGDPCVGTGNPDCQNPLSSDWTQQRVHYLENGSLVWDLAGNLSEQVDGSTGGPDGLWMSFDGSAFTVDTGWQDARLAFAPQGTWTEAHGVGRMYGGTGNLTRGGSFDHSNPGTASSAGMLDTGIFQAHHNSWNTTTTNGFRCVFVPM